ncbi:oxidoreductase [Salinarimonas soli]|uniref:SDR family NAD(P)-dependent oxidoreductase n=1 Tax=Salinarimonas soli TaxID=1638099 RepID=A0A5B2VBF6_9HYPH|nr:oxidoreductase [Salinarimonas soli]KAA2236304.1 SDR family NAD(P)-dependent oxidoreductase [Salinarimonas soli]
MSKVWFITGASSGFGRALAEAVLARGDRAVLAARRREALEEIASLYPDTALALALDVTDADARERAVAEALERFGRIDVLANIAGRGSLGAAEEFSPQQLREQMEMNFFAAAEMTRAVLPAMRAQGSGHVLQLTSIGGLASFPAFAPYCASKYALEGWSEALAGEVAPLGIRVTIVEPGAFRTEFAGASNMRPAARIDAYRPVIEPVERYLYGSDGQQPGDPARAAQAMIQAVESGKPPLRLLLGSDAIGLWETKRAAVDADLAAWRSVGEGTAFPGAETKPVGG